MTDLSVISILYALKRENRMSVTIDLSRDELLEDYAVGMLKDFYLNDYENSPQEAYARAAKAWATFKDELDVQLAQRL